MKEPPYERTVMQPVKSPAARIKLTVDVVFDPEMNLTTREKFDLIRHTAAAEVNSYMVRKFVARRNRHGKILNESLGIYRFRKSLNDL
jgi:hypothetical protein